MPPPTHTQGGRKSARAAAVLVIALAANLLLLFSFKYVGLAAKILNKLWKQDMSIPNRALPIGISFYTFQAMSYIIDVYRNPSLRQKNLLHLGLYISFFPQLVAGPIVRYSDIRAQIEKRVHSIENVACGMERFIIGLAKKVLIANIAARCCDCIYGLDPSAYSPMYAWIAAAAHTLQIYYDFSGYSDMAIGLGRMFGFRFKENFEHPYAAKGIRDFWRRWHISLSSWFRDYVYIPLGGNRVSEAWTIANKYIVFLLTGLWHGASVNFVVWGLGHGTLMMIEDVMRHRWGKIEAKMPKRMAKGVHLAAKVVWRAFAMLAVVLLWVVFRNVDWRKGAKVVLNMAGLLPHGVLTRRLMLLAEDRVVLLAMAAGAVFAVPWWRAALQGQVVQRLRAVPFVRVCLPYVKGALLLCLLIASAACLSYGAYNPFIYFRF